MSVLHLALEFAWETIGVRLTMLQYRANFRGIGGYVREMDPIVFAVIPA